MCSVVAAAAAAAADNAAGAAAGAAGARVGASASAPRLSRIHCTGRGAAAARASTSASSLAKFARSSSALRSRSWRASSVCAPGIVGAPGHRPAPDIDTATGQIEVPYISALPISTPAGAAMGAAMILAAEP